MADLGKAAGRNDDDIGSNGDHFACFGKMVEMHADSEPLHLACKPARDTREIAAPCCLGGEHDLSAKLACGLEERDLVTAHVRDPRRLEARRPAAHHDDMFRWPLAACHDVRQGELTAGCDIMEAERILAEEHPVDAIARPDTGTYLGFPSLPELAHVM